MAALTTFLFVAFLRPSRQTRRISGDGVKMACAGKTMIWLLILLPRTLTVKYMCSYVKGGDCCYRRANRTRGAMMTVQPVSIKTMVNKLLSIFSKLRGHRGWVDDESQWLSAKSPTRFLGNSRMLWNILMSAIILIGNIPTWYRVASPLRERIRIWSRWQPGWW